MANRLVMDGSRVCAATNIGVFCSAREEAEWRPAFLEGRQVLDLVKIKSGWVAVLLETNPDDPRSPLRRAYLSQDGGTSWLLLERKPWVVDDAAPIIWDYNPRTWDHYLYAYGDSLLSRRITGEGYSFLDLSEDGGQTWKPLPEAGFPGDNHLIDCAPSAQSILCVVDGLVYRLSSLDQPGVWKRLGNSYVHWNTYFGNGRIYDQDSLGVTVFGPTGLEKRLPGTLLKIFFVTDSLVLAKSQLFDEYAYLQGDSTSWTPLKAPTGTLQGLRTGVWTGKDALFLSHHWSPQRVRLEPGNIVREPFSRGLRSLRISALGAVGRDLLTWNPEAVSRRDSTGVWRTLFRGEPSISSFWQSDGMAMLQVSRDSAATLFSNDTGKTWRQPPASLVGTPYNMVKLGGKILALTSSLRYDSNGVPQLGNSKLYETADVLGTWSLRAEYVMAKHFSGLAVCGARLFAARSDGLFHSLDTGKTWVPIQFMSGYSMTILAQGMRLCVRDDKGRFFESRNCSEEFTLMQTPSGMTGPWGAINLTAGQPLAAFYDQVRLESRVYPLSGASPEWNGIEAQVLPGMVNGLLLHEGVLYANLFEKGLYAMDPQSARIGPGARSRVSSSPRRFGRWRRIDGRAIPAGALPAQTPVFRPGFAK